MELQNLSIAFISRFHFHYSPHSTDRRWCLFAIQKTTKAIFATLTKQFLLADEEFSSKKLKKLSSMELQNVSFAFISRFRLQNSEHSTDRKWCLFAIQKITKAIFATPTKQFFLADEEFSSKKLKKLSSMEIQNVSNASIWRFHFHYSPHSSDRKWCLFAIRKITKAIFATPTKQCLLADEEFSSKNPNNWAAWNYRMWVLRLSHVLIFNIHLIQQTGSDACLRIGKKLLSSRHQRNNFC